MNDSMINPSVIELLNKVDNRYSLVVATSRRARQLIEGEEPRITTVGNKPLTIAINEVNEGIVTITEQEQEEENTNGMDEEEVKDSQEAEEGLV